MTDSERKPQGGKVNSELIVKDIKADGTVICGTPEETKAFDEKTKTIFRNVTACHHCDKEFPESYIRWHAARAHKREDRMAVLTCKKCFCWTPVQFNFSGEAESA
jgi:hypothetical protein